MEVAICLLPWGLFFLMWIVEEWSDRRHCGRNDK